LGATSQRRYWEHAIRDDQDLAAHLDYVHFNPVRHGYVSHPADWPYSSFHACVARGLYPSHWIGSDDGGDDRGERAP
jgi:putative transposase